MRNAPLALITQGILGGKALQSVAHASIARADLTVRDGTAYLRICLWTRKNIKHGAPRGVRVARSEPGTRRNGPL